MYTFDLNENVVVQNTGGAPFDPVCISLDGKIGKVVGYYHHPKHFTLVEFEEVIITAYLKTTFDSNGNQIDSVEYFKSTVVVIPNGCLRLVL